MEERSRWSLKGVGIDPDHEIWLEGYAWWRKVVEAVLALAFIPCAIVGAGLLFVGLSKLWFGGAF